MVGMSAFAGKFLVAIIFAQAVCESAGATKKEAKPPAGKEGDVEKLIASRIKATPKNQLNRYKSEAAKHLQSNLVKALQAMSTSSDKSFTPKVKSNAKTALTAVQSGKLNGALAKGLPTIMRESAPLQGKPAEQLKAILGNILPNAPGVAKAPLQGVQDFLQANVNGVNTLLFKTLGGGTDLLSGVVKSLLGSLGGINAAVNGTVNSLGTLLGGLL